jgi:hypothetical protein
VARKVLGGQVLVLRGDRLDTEVVGAVRRRSWPEELVLAPALLIDGPSFLQRRPGVTRLLAQLLQVRAADGRKTAVCQGADESVMLLADAVDPDQRATVSLRFPQRRGRLRFAKRRCVELGLPPSSALELNIDEPWTYLKVIRALKRVAREAPQG